MKPKQTLVSHRRQRVVVLGASDRPDSYAYMALQLLQQKGYEVIPVNPNVDVIGQLAVLGGLDEVSGSVDTLTLYVSPRISTSLIDQVVKLKPGRVIFNPGSENSELAEALQQCHIPFEYACTLVLLRTDQF